MTTRTAVNTTPDKIEVPDTAGTGTFTLLLFQYRLHGIAHPNKWTVAGLYNGQPHDIGLLTKDPATDLYTTILFNRESEPGQLETVLTVLANTMQNFR